MIPKVLGPWLIGNELGHGEFSGVHECKRKDPKPEEEGTLWCAKSSPTVPPVFKKKETKAEISCRLLNWENMVYQHLISSDSETRSFFPKRPKYQNFGDFNGWRVLVIENIPGGTIKNKFEERGNNISHHAIFSCGVHILAAFEYLHKKRFLYRDLKPENVMLGNSTTRVGPVLVDFGAACQYVDLKGQHLMTEKDSAGTPQFMSRGIHSKNPPARRDDLESLGYLLAWMIGNGQLPWSKAKSEMEILNSKNNLKLIDQICEESKELREYFNIVFQLGIQDTPDYSKLKQILTKAAGGKVSSVIDWDVPEVEEKITKSATKKKGITTTTTTTTTSSPSRNTTQRNKVSTKNKEEENNTEEEEEEVQRNTLQRTKKGAIKGSEDKQEESLQKVAMKKSKAAARSRENGNKAAKEQQIVEEEEEKVLKTTKGNNLSVNEKQQVTTRRKSSPKRKQEKESSSSSPTIQRRSSRLATKRQKQDEEKPNNNQKKMKLGTLSTCAISFSAIAIGLGVLVSSQYSVN